MWIRVSGLVSGPYLVLVLEGGTLAFRFEFGLHIQGTFRVRAKVRVMPGTAAQEHPRSVTRRAALPGDSTT